MISAGALTPVLVCFHKLEITPLSNFNHSRDGTGELPAGRYATLTYVDHAIRANRHLFEWTDTASLTLDRRATPAGDAFGCRYEAILSDERREKRKTRWRVQLNFKLVD